MYQKEAPKKVEDWMDKFKQGDEKIQEIVQ